METVVTNPAEDRQACESDCRREAELDAAKKQNSWMRYDEYLSWILANPPVIPRA